MNVTILHGNIVSAPELGKLDIVENGYLVAEDGIIVGGYETLPEKYAGCEVEDYGDKLVFQTFSTCTCTLPSTPCWAWAWICP